MYDMFPRRLTGVVEVVEEEEVLRAWISVV